MRQGIAGEIMKRSLIVFAVALAVLTAGCSKKNLPSGPGSAAGTPVLLTGTPRSNISHQVRIDGIIKNQSGTTIYQVQVGVEVFRIEPSPHTFDTLCDVGIDSIHNGQSATFGVGWFYGNTFLNAYPSYTTLPPSP